MVFLVKRLWHRGHSMISHLSASTEYKSRVIFTYEQGHSLRCFVENL